MNQATTQRLLAAIDNAKEASYGTDEQSDLGQRRARAIEAYLGLNTNPAAEGKSQVVDRSVYETIATLTPSIVRIFASSSEDVCKSLPIGKEDEEAAEQTTAVLTHVVTRQNQWEQLFTDWLLDAMLLCNGYAFAYWDESDAMVEETYEGQTPDQLSALLQDPALVMTEANVAESDSGEQTIDVVVERPENPGKVCISILPPEHCRVSIHTPDWTLRECPFFEFRQRKTIAELREMGLEVPIDISDDEEDTDEDRARDRFGEDRDVEDKGVTRQVWARMTWIRADLAGKGESKLWYAIVVGRTVLHHERCNRIPVSSMTPQPMPHRHVGMSIAETVIDLQNIKTVVKRGGLDNLYLANAPRHVISSKVSVDDYLDARPGLPIRMLDHSMPGEGHIFPLVHPFAFDQIIGSLEYFDQERQNRTGASRYFSGTDAGAINKTASGTIALQNMASMRVEHLARTMSPAVEALFEIVHELISKHQNKPLTVQLRGGWVPVDPQAWKTKRDLRIAVGVGAGNKESMMAQLQGVLGAQMQIGLPLGLVTRDNVRATNVEIMKLAGFANPDRFWPPTNQLPPQQPQPSPEQIKAQTEMQKLQFQAQQDQMKTQADAQARQREAEQQAFLDKNREEMQARQKAMEAMMNERSEAQNRELQKWLGALDAAVKLEIANRNAETSVQTQQMGADASMKQLQASKEPAEPDTRVDDLKRVIDELIEERDSPAELIRNPQNGRTEAVKRGNRVRQVVRGPDGRAIGLQ